MLDPLRRFAERPLAEWQELFRSSPREEERYQALQALVALSDRDQAVGWMIQGLHDADSSLRAAAVRWLANQADGAKRPSTDVEWAAIRTRWQELLEDGDPDVRFEAARGLLTLDAKDGPATTVLLTLLSEADTQPAMRAAVLKALSLGCGPSDASVVEWPKLLQHAQAEVREQAARTLGVWGVRSTELAHALLLLLDDEEPFVREEAAKSLGRIGLASEKILSALEVATSDDDAPVTEAARTSLLSLRDGASSL